MCWLLIVLICLTFSSLGCWSCVHLGAISTLHSYTPVCSFCFFHMQTLSFISNHANLNISIAVLYNNPSEDFLLLLIDYQTLEWNIQHEPQGVEVEIKRINFRDYDNPTRECICSSTNQLLCWQKSGKLEI